MRDTKDLNEISQNPKERGRGGEKIGENEGSGIVLFSFARMCVD